MRRIYAVIELSELSTFNADADTDLDELADDLLRITDGVASVGVYPSLADLQQDHDES